MRCKILILASFVVLSTSCASTGSTNAASSTLPEDEQWVSPPRLATLPENDGGQCDQGSAETHQISEYDTTGDNIPDVRKVFRRVNGLRVERLILTCREVDLNTDGVKDLFRFYDDEGFPLREEADRNFDGIIEEVSFFEDGVVILRELDTNGDGEIDTKWHYNKIGILKAESDTSGKSSSTSWEPNRWAYFENGEVTRIGEDVDADGRVDLWDRKPMPEEQQETEQSEVGQPESDSAPSSEDSGNQEEIHTEENGEGES